MPKKRRLRKDVKQKLVIIGCLLGLILIIVFTVFPLFKRVYVNASRYPASVLGVPVTTELLPEGSEKRPGMPHPIKYIVIHETDNFKADADAANHSAYLLNDTTGRLASWHYTVDDHAIFHHLPDNEVAWHAGDKQTPNGGNMNGIAIELCVNEGSDFTKTLDNAAKLTAYLLDEYKLKISDIKEHNNFSGKDCPAKIRKDNLMPEFLNKVKQYLKEIRNS